MIGIGGAAAISADQQFTTGTEAIFQEFKSLEEREFTRVEGWSALEETN